VDEVDDLLHESPEDLFEHAPCGYLSLCPDGSIARVNRTFLDLTGYERGELVQKHFRDLLTIPGKVFHDTHFAPLLALQSSVNAVALELLRPGRDPVPVIVNAVVKRSDDGRTLLTKVTVFDATDRRQFEREIMAARKRAEQAAETERAARAQAEQALRAKDEFLALVSHELRTPLNAILGWTQILQGGTIDDPDLRDGLDVIERNTRVQVQLVEDLLDMGRIASGKMRFDVQRVNLASVIEAAIETSRPAAQAKKIRLQTVLDPAVIVSGDPGRLQQVFWNLLANAMKFTPSGGCVRVVMERVNSHIEVSVIDSGQGMKPGFLVHAFEKFSQSDTPGTRKTGGLGLGLSIVKHLTEMHGGSVRATSEGEGKGSTFIVSLPVVAVRQEETSGERIHPGSAVTNDPVSVNSVTLEGVKILVVDDEKDAREVIRRLLASARAEVVTAASTAEAIEIIQEARPDVLVSDIGMPGQDGYELIRRVRMLGGGVGSTKAVALTAFARLEDRTRAMLAGYQMHLAKPVEPSELIVTVAVLTGRVRS
jgi:PAS domain S-box-containing protein